MQPLLADGDYLIFRKTRPTKPAASLHGRAVVVAHPHFGQIVKIAVPSGPPDKIGLKGLSLLSTAPEHLGEVGLTAVEGVGWLRVSPQGLSFVRKTD